MTSAEIKNLEKRICKLERESVRDDARRKIAIAVDELCDEDLFLLERFCDTTVPTVLTAFIGLGKKIKDHGKAAKLDGQGVKYRQELKDKGYSLEGAAQILGVHYTHLLRVLDGSRRSKRLLNSFINLPDLNRKEAS